MNEKFNIRKNFLSQRINISELEYQKKNQKLLLNIKNSQFISNDIFCCFSPIKKEPNITSLLTVFPEKTFFFPKVLNEQQMDFYSTKSLSELKPGHFSVLEPRPVEAKRLKKNTGIIFFVPGIVFDRNGCRLGYGKGYYDYYFNNLTIPKRMYTLVGVAFSQQIYEFRLPQIKNDVPMDFLVTDEGIMKGVAHENL